MFCGHYIEKHINGELEIPFDVQDKTYELLCIKDAAEHVYIIICATDDEDIKEIKRLSTVLREEQLIIKNTIKLPQEFLEYIPDDEVGIFGCYNKIEIHRKEPYKAQKLSKEETIQLILSHVISDENYEFEEDNNNVFS